MTTLQRASFTSHAGPTASARRILVVDHRREQARAVAMLVAQLETELDVASSGEEALAKLAYRPADLVLAAVPMSGLDALHLLDAVVRRWPATRVIILSAEGSIEDAVTSIQRGACDYLSQPVADRDLVERCRRALELPGAGTASTLGPAADPGPTVFEGMVGATPLMTALFATIRKVAASDATVVVEGEHGTGKELVARAIHRLSGRKGPFIAFSAAAVPESLMEAELFGCLKGAFTGADHDRKGYFLEADGGTLFFDEVGSMPASMQVRLLRALQEREVLPVGSARPVRTDVRVVAATNADLLHATRHGHFREDLYYRLSVLRLALPPLKERVHDVPLLATHFVRRRCRERGLAAKELTPRALWALMRHSWPGNVRELQSVVERAVLFSPGPSIDTEHITFDVERADGGAQTAGSYADAKRASVERFQRQYVERLLADTHGNISEAARRAGLTRAALHRMLNRLG